MLRKLTTLGLIALVILMAASAMSSASTGQNELLFKWLTVPWTNETKQVSAVQLWEVRWTSRYGQYYHSVKPEVEAFTSEEQAKAFKKSLENAFALTRNTSDDSVDLVKAR